MGKLMNIGDARNLLTLIAIVEGSTNSRNTTGRFRCLCGNVIDTKMFNVYHNNKKSCGCARPRKSYGESAKTRLYSAYVNNAKKSNRDFALDREEFFALTAANCFYCGAEPKSVSSVRCNTGVYLYNGIDRKDNSKGYTRENCVSCCETCNRAKLKMSADDFIAHCTKVHNLWGAK